MNIWLKSGLLLLVGAAVAIATSDADPDDHDVKAACRKEAGRH